MQTPLPSTSNARVATGVVAVDPTAEIQLPIEGMSCASCVNRIERHLRKTPGVAEANVNLATEIATVRYMPEIAGMDELARAIEAAGYEIRETQAPAEAVRWLRIGWLPPWRLRAKSPSWTRAGSTRKRNLCSRSRRAS